MHLSLSYFLCCSSLRLPVAGVFPRRANTSKRVTVLASGVVVMVIGKKAVTRQQRLCPKPTHAVLTAGEQNITHCTSVRRGEGKGKGKRKDNGKGVKAHVCWRALNLSVMISII